MVWFEAGGGRSGAGTPPWRRRPDGSVVELREGGDAGTVLAYGGLSADEGLHALQRGGHLPAHEFCSCLVLVHLRCRSSTEHAVFRWWWKREILF
uniref:Uncharacterized protein n=1 Tax=Arundo donax TaxID=35708 RepID=A0A0A9GQV4_ARUDO